MHLIAQPSGWRFSERVAFTAACILSAAAHQVLQFDLLVNCRGRRFGSRCWRLSFPNRWWPETWKSEPISIEVYDLCDISDLPSFSTTNPNHEFLAYLSSQWTGSWPMATACEMHDPKQHSAHAEMAWSQRFRVTPDDSLNFFLGKELQMFSRPVRKRTFESSQRQNRHEIWNAAQNLTKRPQTKVIPIHISRPLHEITHPVARNLLHRSSSLVPGQQCFATSSGWQ